MREPEQVEQKLTPPTRIQMRTYHSGAKQAVVKRKRLEYIIVG